MTADTDTTDAVKTTETDKCSDVFAYAVLLWELLLRRRPWTRSDGSKIPAAAVRKKVLEGGRLPVTESLQRDFPEFSELLGMCWKTEPTDRPSFHEIKEFIGVHYGGQASATGTTSGTTATPLPPMPTRRQE